MFGASRDVSFVAWFTVGMVVMYVLIVVWLVVVWPVLVPLVHSWLGGVHGSPYVMLALSRLGTGQGV